MKVILFDIIVSCQIGETSLTRSFLKIGAFSEQEAVFRAGMRFNSIHCQGSKAKIVDVRVDKSKIDTLNPTVVKRHK